MSVDNLFETASRKKMRFNYKGMLTVEDLWDLNVVALNEIFKGLNAQAKKSQEESLLEQKTEADKDLMVQIEILRHIVGVKIEEANRRKKAKEVREKKQHIMELIDQKKDENMKSMSVEELQAMLASLGE